MLNKKYNGKKIAQAKYVNNKSINEYASGDIHMKNSIKKILDILIKEKCKEKNLFF